MRHRFAAAAVGLIALLLMSLPLAADVVAYPDARLDDVATDFHGTIVPDPYRWLEDTASDETRAFIDAQNALFDGWLDSGLSSRIRDRLGELVDYERVGVPSRAGRPNASGLEGRGVQTFVSTNDGLQNHNVLHVSGPATAGGRVPLIDPNGWGHDGTFSLAGFWPAPDGATAAYAISKGGSDDRDVYVMDLRPNRLGGHYPERLRHMRFSTLAWHPGGRGFWYSKYPEPHTVAPGAERLNQAVWWHDLGQDPGREDVKVLDFPADPTLSVAPGVTSNGEFLLAYTYRGTDRRAGIVYKAECCNPAYAGGFLPLFEPGEAEYSVVDDPRRQTPDGEKAFMVILTNRNAPAGRLVRVDPGRRDPSRWETLIPEPAEPGVVLEQVVRAGDRYVAIFMQDARGVLKTYDLEGGDEREITLPAVGTVTGLDGESWHDTLYFGFTNYTYPTTPFSYDLKTGELTQLADNAPAGFEPEAYETEQVFFESRDGTRVPMFVTHKKGLRRHGKSPTILYGYGGFNVSLTPSFSSVRLAWLEQGGVYAVANLRGGGEYGQAWHEAGKLLNKQNVFDDFHAAAEYLIQAGYTNGQNLAIQGGSNGGLLTAVAAQQRPELYAAAHVAVPVTDMLRYHTFGTGRFWTVEYGDPDADKETFENLLRYSPLHNARRDRRHPATLVTTGDGDDRVVPAHSLKYVAAMQHANPPHPAGGPASGGPILLRYDVGTGHGAGKPLAKALDEQAEVFAFFARALGMELRNVAAGHPATRPAGDH